MFDKSLLWSPPNYPIQPLTEVLRESRANIIPRFAEPRRVNIVCPEAPVRPPVFIRHQSQLMLVKVSFGVEEELHMTPILKLTVAFGEI